MNDYTGERDLSERAIESLARLGPDATEAVEDLVSLLESQRPIHRKLACDALKIIGQHVEPTTHIEEALERLDNDKSVSVRKSADEALHRLRYKGIFPP